jgi:hypothetical protein
LSKGGESAPLRVLGVKVVARVSAVLFAVPAELVVTIAALHDQAALVPLNLRAAYRAKSDLALTIGPLVTLLVELLLTSKTLVPVVFALETDIR